MDEIKETCNGCGSPVNPSHTKCSWCGRFHIEPILPVSVKKPIAKEPNPKIKMKWWMMLFFGIVVVGAGVGAGAFFFYYLKKSQNKNKKSVFA